jgi:hypothetical protein
MKILRKVGLLLFIVFVGIQFIPTTRNESDKILDSDIIRTFNPSEKISNLLRN